MGDGTKIEWATASLTPVRARDRETGKVGWHCQHVTPGCERCYAETLNRRLGTGHDYIPQHRDRVELFLDEKMLTQPLRWRRPRRIFWGSMTDLFARFVPDDWLDRIFAVCALTPQHTHLFLTKRADRMRDYLNGHAAGGRHIWEAGQGIEMPRGQSKPQPGWPLPNCWLGVSVEDQPRADERIPLLLDTPAAVRWISAEPLLAPVDLTDLGGEGSAKSFGAHGWSAIWKGNPLRPSLDLVVVGGESGPGARPMELRWISDIVSQCQAAKVPVFVKQIGARPVIGGQQYTFYNGGPVDVKPKDRKGGDWSEWPASLRVREMPA